MPPRRTFSEIILAPARPWWFGNQTGAMTMKVDTNSCNVDAVLNGPVLLTADEIGQVSGGVKVEIEVPPHIYIGIKAASFINTVQTIAGPFGLGIPVAAGAVALGLFDAWAEPKLSNARSSN
jgi:hypothetical protein